jgi:hypothetical protein
VKHDLRRRVLDQLAAGGPIVDPDGYATGRLRQAVGPEGTDGSFTQLLGRMARDGAIIKDTVGLRTYRIALPAAADDDVDITDGVMGDELELPPPPGVDLRALADAVLDAALAAAAKVDAAEKRAAAAEDHLQRTVDAGTAREQLHRQALKEQGRAQDAALEAERRRAAMAEEAAAVFRERCADLDNANVKLKKALGESEAELHKAKAKVTSNGNGSGYPVRELLRPESRAELDRLMRQVPARRG